MKLLVFFLSFLAIFPAIAQEAALNNFQIKGWGFIRHETKKNADYDSNLKDKTDFTQTRINISAKADLQENYGYVFFAPQFSKISGQPEFSSTSTTANTSNSTSGNLYDSRLDMHEAFFAIKPTKDENLYFFAGRQELSYGDHLILGSVPWHRIGRSFDGGKVRYKFATNFSLDAFSMTLKENNSAAPASSVQDAKLDGAYLSGSLNSYVKQADLYFLRRDNQQTGAFKDTSAYGVRFKSIIGESKLDYRVEATLEQVKMIADNSVKTSEYQMDFELGWSMKFYETRLAFEYFDSTENYDQLFPTAHKFLGYADQYSRRNIKGQVLHLSTKPDDKITFLADYHFFQKHDSKGAAYRFDGTSLGSNGSSNEIAQELDLVAAYDFTKTLQISYGFSWVMPGKYIKDQTTSKTSNTNWSYLQLLARF